MKCLKSVGIKGDNIPIASEIATSGNFRFNERFSLSELSIFPVKLIFFVTLSSINPCSMYRVSATVLVLSLVFNFDWAPSFSRIIFLSSKLPSPSGRELLGRVPEKLRLVSLNLILVPPDSAVAFSSFRFVTIPEGEVVVSIFILPVISPFKNSPLISSRLIPLGAGVIEFEMLSTTADTISVFLMFTFPCQSYLVVPGLLIINSPLMPSDFNFSSNPVKVASEKSTLYL